MASAKSRGPSMPLLRKAAPSKNLQERTKVKAAEKAARRKAKQIAHRVGQAEALAKVTSEIEQMRAESSAVLPPAPKFIQKPDGGSFSRHTFDIEYTTELDQYFFYMVATGHSIDSISAEFEKHHNVPMLYRFLCWLADETHAAYLTYTRARAVMVPLFEERVIQNALNPLVGVVRVTRNEDGVESTEIRESDNVQRSALIDGAYKWTLAHLMPKKHGKNAQPQSGEPNDQLNALFNALKAGPVETP